MPTKIKPRKSVERAAKPEPKVVEAVQRVYKVGSLLSQLKAMDVDSYVARVMRVDTEQSIGDFEGRASGLRQLFRNNVQSSVNAAKLATEGEYSMEVTTVMTTSNRLYHLAVITRTV